MCEAISFVIVRTFLTVLVIPKSNHGSAALSVIFLCFFICYVSAVISRSHEGPGEMGKAVNIPKDDQEKMKELFKINQFNLMASDMIALNRSLPDVRLDGCVEPVCLTDACS